MHVVISYLLVINNMNIEMLNLVEIGVHFTSCFMKKYVVIGFYSYMYNL